MKTSRAFDSFDDRIDSILVTQVFQRSIIGIVATIINASIITYITWEYTRQFILIAWLTASLILSFVRLGLYAKFLKAVASDNYNLRRWRNSLIIGVGTSGVLWGTAAIFLFPEESVAHQAFIALVLAGMVAGAVGVYAPITPAFLAFGIPTLVPITIRFFLINDEIHMAMGAMAALFAALTFTTARGISITTREYVGLKESFARQLEDRTDELKKRGGELEEVNQKLRHEIEERKRAEQKLHELNEMLEMRVAKRTLLAIERAKQLQTLSVQLIEAEERERQRIAEILHDDLQQTLAAARMQLEACNISSDPMLSGIELLISESISKSRRLSHELSPAVLHHSGLIEGLSWLTRYMDEAFGLKVELVVNAGDVDCAHSKLFLFRAVQELLFNVVKHSGVKAAMVELAQSKNRVVLTVSDQGRGLNPNYLDTHFEPKGLGLISLRERARYFGGSFVIDSNPDLGSRFTLTLPAKISGKADTRRPPTEYPTDPVVEPDHDVGADATRVLFVDDHKVMRQGLINLIGKQPGIYVAGEASNGREAIEQARNLKPDVIVMDVSMPVMDGIEATRHIKAQWPKVRVIGLSMVEDEHISQSMLKAGAEAFVSKTASAADLLNAIYKRRIE